MVQNRYKAGRRDMRYLYEGMKYLYEGMIHVCDGYKGYEAGKRGTKQLQ